MEHKGDTPPDVVGIVLAEAAAGAGNGGIPLEAPAIALGMNVIAATAANTALVTMDSDLLFLIILSAPWYRGCDDARRLQVL